MYSKVIYMWQNCLATKLKSLCRTNLHAGDKSISQSVNKEEAWDSTDLLGSVCAPEDFYTTFFKAFFSFLDAIASPSTYCQWVGQSVIHSFRFGAIATNPQYLYKIPIPILISTDLLGSVCAPEGRLTRTESWSDRRVPWTLSWEISWFKTWMWEMRDVWWREMYKMWHEVCPEHWGTLSWEFLD